MDGETSVSWDIPGGRISPDETLYEGLARELNEEIGLTDTIPEPQLLAAQDIIVKAKDLHVVRLTYRINCDLKMIRLSDEHSDYRWVGLGETEDMLIEPNLKEVFTRFG